MSENQNYEINKFIDEKKDCLPNNNSIPYIPKTNLITGAAMKN